MEDIWAFLKKAKKSNVSGGKRFKFPAQEACGGGGRSGGHWQLKMALQQGNRLEEGLSLH